MSATSDFMTSPTHVEFSGRSDRSTRLVRNTMRVLGLGFIGAALALWYSPGAIWDMDMVMMKLVVSLICLGTGLTMIQMVPARESFEIQFDEARREVRVIDEGNKKSVLRRSYDSLGRALVGSNVVTLWDKDGSELVSLPIDDDDTHHALCRQLGPLCA